MRQVPLIEPGSGLPSPMFRPRPGWGGRLRAWTHENLYLAVFRTLILAAIVLIGSSLVHSWRRVQVAQNESPTPTPMLHEDHHEVARHGDSLSVLAARALDEHLAHHEDMGEVHTLTAVEHLWVVDQLYRSVTPRPLNVGDEVVFSHDLVHDLVTRAKQLTRYQRAALSQYLR